jgi:hypothetical protein
MTNPIHLWFDRANITYVRDFLDPKYNSRVG